MIAEDMKINQIYWINHTAVDMFEENERTYFKVTRINKRTVWGIFAVNRLTMKLGSIVQYLYKSEIIEIRPLNEREQQQFVLEAL